ncbi:hypothetical protein JMJ77_0013052 [Colletotrichum scovillei]|uniref:Uncharacterized protein n=1 Tax=Colletotrichum scovillei TaxID=1209932 RepID=A0A9P7UI83_9PEZI|nr:hypothetical protein JMJ77_0013052 [Colletotrichum scovillei]KAG7069340.1 hypothetical protein JMJ76_0003013 [Colletotrichum scovillei]KAG7073321.1 hypothetical protein JMJ78_0014300 [Colletotrichum scovillei]
MNPASEHTVQSAPCSPPVPIFSRFFAGKGEVECSSNSFRIA